MFRHFFRINRECDGFRINAFDALDAGGAFHGNGGYDDLDRRADFTAVFEKSPQGRRVLQQILHRCRACERSYVPGDTHETARREGARDIGLWLLEILTEPGGENPSHAEAERPDPSADG